jgi:1-acyl-sn-glycerol-3-phosphate acyltransferase
MTPLASPLRTFVTAIRSAAFLIASYTWTAALIVLYLPLLALLRRQQLQPFAAFWCRGVIALARWLCGIRYRIEGREHLAAGPLIVAAKHQSAWDTLIFHQLLADPCYVLKRELLRIPLFGLYLARLGSIPVDRDAGFRAIKTLLPAVAERLAEGAQIIVFPEGTRVTPGVPQPYHPGIAALYSRFDAPVTPVALNSGLFWGRNAFLRYPGEITVEVMPPVPRGLSREAFLALLQQRIEQATDRLCRSRAQV